jgi:hypothetical protein
MPKTHPKNDAHPPKKNTVPPKRIAPGHDSRSAAGYFPPAVGSGRFLALAAAGPKRWVYYLIYLIQGGAP